MRAVTHEPTSLAASSIETPWPADLLEALDASWDGIAYIDVNGRVAWTNRVLTSWITVAQAPRAWETMLASADREEAEAAYRRMLASGVERFESRLNGPEPRRYLCTLSALGHRGYRGAMLLVHNVERAKNGGVEEAARLRALNEARTRFINTAAHEFSTPLTPLRLQAHLLKTGRLGPLSAEQKISVDILDRNMERLAKLVQNVLDVARVGADRLLVEKEPIDVADVVGHAIASLQAAAQQNGLALNLDAHGPIEVLGDSDRLTQVVVNLVHNAIKFTPPGGRIDVRLVVQGGRVRVDVTDTGVGLRAEDIPQLFQPFSQGHAGLETALSGSGLGLSIAQGIVAQHGGRIWCESPGPGSGATFSFDLPLMEAANETETIGIALQSRDAEARHGWTLFYFKCPQCGSRDLEVRLLRNRYDCHSCGYVWR